MSNTINESYLKTRLLDMYIYLMIWEESNALLYKLGKILKLRRDLGWITQTCDKHRQGNATDLPSFCPLQRGQVIECSHAKITKAVRSWIKNSHSRLEERKYSAVSVMQNTILFEFPIKHPEN